MTMKDEPNGGQHNCNKQNVGLQPVIRLKIPPCLRLGKHASRLRQQLRALISQDPAAFDHRLLFNCPEILNVVGTSFSYHKQSNIHNNNNNINNQTNKPLSSEVYQSVVEQQYKQFTMLDAAASGVGGGGQLKKKGRRQQLMIVESQQQHQHQQQQFRQLINRNKNVYYHPSRAQKDYAQQPQWTQPNSNSNYFHDDQQRHQQATHYHQHYPHLKQQQLLLSTMPIESTSEYHHAAAYHHRHQQYHHPPQLQQQRFMPCQFTMVPLRVPPLNLHQSSFIAVVGHDPFNNNTILQPQQQQQHQFRSNIWLPHN